jgi:transposase InsO family protein
MANTVDEESLENNIHDPSVIRRSLEITHCGAIQLKKDDSNVKLQDVREWQQNDPNIREEIVAKLSGDGARFGRLRKLYVIRDNVLHRHPQSIANGEERVVVPAEKAQILLQRFHDHEAANHPGWKETYQSIKSHFFWAGMRETVWNYVRAYHLCACVKPLNRKPEDQMCTRIPRQPWEVLSIDLMGPYPRTQRGKTTILVVTDCYSRWVEAYPLGKATTKSIVDTFERELFPRIGYPRALLSDNGPQFVSKAMGEAIKRWGSEGWTTPIYHPRANPVERRNQELKKGLQTLLVDKPHHLWDVYLPHVLFSVRTERTEIPDSHPPK